MTDLITETEDQMRRERLEALWKEHKFTLASIIAGIILGTALYSGLKHWQTAQKIKGTNAMFEILDDKTFPNNVALDTEIGGPAGLEALTLLKAADGYLKQEQEPDAIALYQTVQQNKNAPESFRSLALLMEVRLLAAREDSDKAALVEKLKPIAANDKSPYQAHARLEIGSLYGALEQYEEAGTWLEKIKEMPLLPETLYMRAQALSHVYKVRAEK